MYFLLPSSFLSHHHSSTTSTNPSSPSLDDGYRLTYGGLDYLALHTHLKHSVLFSLGNQIGVGKESDIYVAASPSGTTHVVKLHRLGRISFRSVKANRDYLRHRSGGSWMYMSRLAALKEFTFMKALRENGFPVPEPIAHSRHTIVMSLIDAFPLRQISEVPDPAGLYAELIEMILRLAKFGLIHGDFNEFNILIKEETKQSISSETSESIPESLNATSGAPGTLNPNTNPSPTVTLTPILIDFPQMVSMSHIDAAMYFDRDVNCIKTFFQRRFHFMSSTPGPFFEDAKKTVGRDNAKRLDVEAEASGFSKKMSKDLEAYMKEVGANAPETEDKNTESEDDKDISSDESEGHGEELELPVSNLNTAGTKFYDKDIADLTKSDSLADTSLQSLSVINDT